MLLKEIIEGWTENRHEYELHNNPAHEPTYGLMTQSGKIIRPNLSLPTARALMMRPDLIKRYGKLFLKKTS